MKLTKISLLALSLVTGIISTAFPAENTITTITLAGSKNLISLPCIPINSDPLSVFNGFNIHNNLSAWLPTEQTTNIFNSAAPELFGGMLAGEGYWLKGTAGQQIQYESIPNGIPTDGILTDMWIPLPGADNGMNNGGDHLIGCPYDTFVPITNIQFTNGIEILTWPQANSAGWVGSSISYWADSAYNNITCNGPNAVTVLQPGKGYLIKSNVNNLAMIINAPPTGYTLSSTVNLGDYDPTKRAGVPVRVQLNIGSETVRTVYTSLNADGKFYIHNVQPGTYDVGIKPSHWLRRVVSGVTVGESDLDFVIH